MAPPHMKITFGCLLSVDVWDMGLTTPHESTCRFLISVDAWGMELRHAPPLIHVGALSVRMCGAWDWGKVTEVCAVVYDYNDAVHVHQPLCH